MVNEDINIEINEGPARIVLSKAKAQGLVISRVPQRIRDNFIKLSDDEFAGDYGMTLAFLWNNFELWNAFMNNWNIKLDYIISRLDNQNTQRPEIKKMLAGNIIKLKGGQNE